MSNNTQVFIRQMTSNDFINISDPPRPKESPSISEFTTPNGSYIQDTDTEPRLLQRRRSTNYTDALNLRKMNQLREQSTNHNTYQENHQFASAYDYESGFLTQKMNYEDIKHDIQSWQDCYDYHPTYSNSTVDMGDHVQHKNDSDKYTLVDVPSKPVLLFKSDYLETENDRGATLPSMNTSASNGYTTKGLSSKQQMFRRRSSFEYEDFKKDIYDRLKFFEG